jgi:hypothetical protein
MQTYKKLAEQLNDIAQGSSYYGDALYVALEHPVTTCNDKQMLARYLYGSELLSDRIRLQELSNYILESKTSC